MAIFPSLTPSTRTYTPGEYPHSPFAGMSGKQNRTRHSNVMLSSQLRLGFVAITEAEMLSILSHYQGQQGSFASFPLPSSVWSGVSSISDYQLTNYGWRYIEPPVVEDLIGGGHNVDLVLETVPPEGTALAGLTSYLSLRVTGGTAGAANGLTRTITTSIAPGEGLAPRIGLAATVSTTVDGGTATTSVAANGLNLSSSSSISSGVAAAATGAELTVTSSIDNLGLVRGYIFTGYATSQSATNTGFNPAETGQANYTNNFGLILPYQPNPTLWVYVTGVGTTGTLSSGTFNYFSPTWRIYLGAFNASVSGDQCWVSVEFQNQSGVTVAALRTVGDGTYRHRLYYGASLAATTYAPQVGSYPNTEGNLTFTSTSLIYTNVRGSNYNNSFTFNCDMQSVTKIKVSNLSVKSNYSGSSNAYVYMKIY